jgi:integrase
VKGHVRKRGTKWAFIIDLGRDEVTGERQQKWFSGFNTKKEAERALAEKINEVNKGTYIEPSDLTLSEYLRGWLQDYAKVNCAPRTYEGYEYIIRDHIIPSLGRITLDKLKPMHIQRYYSQRLQNGRRDGKGGLSPRTVLHHHRVLREALQHAVKWQLLSYNPADAAEAPKPQRKKFNVLSKDEVHKLLDAASKTPYYEAIYMAINTGMRRGEIYGLQWADINFTNKTVGINQTLQRLKGEGLVFRETTKTDGSRRSIAISDNVISMLQKIKTKQKENRLLCGPLYEDHDLVFSNTHGTPINIDYVSQQFGYLVKKIGLQHVRFHDLRHSHATLLLEQGEHPKVVSERLGHSSITITMDLYSHVTPNMQKEAAKKLDDFLFGN